jgi:hypothetical protein
MLDELQEFITFFQHKDIYLLLPSGVLYGKLGFSTPKAPEIIRLAQAYYFSGNEKKVLAGLVAIRTDEIIGFGAEAHSWDDNDSH